MEKEAAKWEGTVDGKIKHNYVLAAVTRDEYQLRLQTFYGASPAVIPEGTLALADAIAAASGVSVELNTRVED